MSYIPGDLHYLRNKSQTQNKSYDIETNFVSSKILNVNRNYKLFRNKLSNDITKPILNETGKFPSIFKN